MASLNGTDLGDVQIEKQRKSSQLFQMPIPTLDSAQAILYDLFGVMRTISVEGLFSGTNAEHVTFINAMEALIAGSQDGVTFVSSKSTISNKTVFVNDFDWRVNRADVSKIDYTLSLIEGESTA